MKMPIICMRPDGIRTVNDFNSEYMYRCWCDEAAVAGQPRKGSAIKSAIFYFVLLSMVVFAFIYSGNKEPGKKFGSFAYNTVLTESMNSVYPQGSLITSWAVKPDEPLMAGLREGTDIVFVKDEEGKVIVHRIIEIIEDYEDKGWRGFRTQGVDNPEPDPWVVDEPNIIGRVTWHLPYAGNILALIADNVLWVVLIIAVFTIILTLLKAAFKKTGGKSY